MGVLIVIDFSGASAVNLCIEKAAGEEAAEDKETAEAKEDEAVAAECVEAGTDQWSHDEANTRHSFDVSNHRLFVIWKKIGAYRVHGSLDQT